MPVPVRKVALGLSLAVYYAAVVLPHEWVQQQLMHLFNRWSFYGYELRFIVAWYAMFIPLCAWVAVRLRRRDPAWLLWAWLGLLLAIAAADRLWLVTMSERVHYLQYGVLAMGLRALLGRHLPALALAVSLGAADEAYQAFVLYADRPELPLDFKDMVLNAMGAAAGALCFEALRRPQRGRQA